MPRLSWWGSEQNSVYVPGSISSLHVADAFRRGVRESEPTQRAFFAGFDVEVVFVLAVVDELEHHLAGRHARARQREAVLGGADLHVRDRRRFDRRFGRCRRWRRVGLAAGPGAATAGGAGVRVGDGAARRRDAGHGGRESRQRRGARSPTAAGCGARGVVRRWRGGGGRGAAMAPARRRGAGAMARRRCARARAPEPHACRAAAPLSAQRAPPTGSARAATPRPARPQRARSCDQLRDRRRTGSARRGRCPRRGSPGRLRSATTVRAAPRTSRGSPTC